MSERSEIADRIAAKVREWRLTAPFGGDVEKSGRYYGILFAKPRTLDGLVRVYGPKFIMVESQGPLGLGRSIFESEEAAVDFIRLAFVELDREEAWKVPTRAR